MRLSFSRFFVVTGAVTCYNVGAAMGDDHNNNKDTTYYPNGMTNPNVDEKMYWENAQGIVADINQFDTLYVTHHGCA